MRSGADNFGTMHQPFECNPLPRSDLPSDVARWHALLTEAEATLGSCLSADVARYLVDLLRRRQTSFRRALVSNTGGDLALRDVGDLMLLWAGLLPEQVLTAGVSIAAVVARGRQAYATLAEQSAEPIYAHLSEDFVAMMDLLQTMREIDRGSRALAPLQAWELWAGTRSRYALQALLRTSPGAWPSVTALQGLH